MGLYPIRQVPGKKPLDIGISAAGQRRHKHIDRNRFPVDVINESGCVPGPIDLHAFTGFMLNAEGCFVFRRIILITVTELGIHEGAASFHPAAFAVLGPQKA
jgi:hypothetical protein